MTLIYVCLPLATLLYVLADVYVTIGSLPALLRSVSFWLLWLIFTVFNSVAFLLLKATTPNLPGITLPPASTLLLLLFFSTIGTFSIIQSFSLKFAKYKAIDLEQVFDGIRAGVLNEAAAEKAALAKDKKLRLVRHLVGHYQTNPALIDQDYNALMTFGGRTPAQNAADIATATLNPATKLYTLVTTMVLADERGARSYLP